ncbi:MAG TPA: GDSL-type esterase/lipase family protein [Spirochaetota bacterium]|nr:hypothetical protein [Spirochaetota bacterium]HOD16726.1 GDSL-type esterase/lipase family protein [Spirochaetota bacterium]HPG49822.1 GDSL-type esterase/lipase family protein [Spirochaetota bacterium]HPN13891.1 GDSL-type esterase/lipase family protein [Spirochaetota bacterium]
MNRQTAAIALCAVILLGAAGCTGKQLTQRQIWLRHVKKVQENNKKACTAGCVLFEGDSNMELIDFQAFLTIPACNYSHRGSTTADVLARKEKVRKLRPAIIVVLVGGNDVVKSYPEETTARNYEELIGFYKSICERVYCISNLPVNPRLYIKNSTMLRLNTRLEKTCRKFGATFINVFPSLYRNGGLNPDYASDPVHLNRAGQEVLMGIVKKYLPK